VSTEPRPDDLGFDLPAPLAVSKKKIFVVVLIVGAALALAFVLGYRPRREAAQALASSNVATENALPRVQVVNAKAVTSDKALVLPGTVTALESTTVYPRVTGYVRRWLVDIGDKVTEGQLLAEIDVPENEAALVQARAELAQAEAGLELANANLALQQINLGRTQRLTEKNLVAKADLDTQQATTVGSQAQVSVARANVEAQRANIKKLTDERAFQRVLAPFAGTVTSRSIDRGALVSAGNSTPLFKIVAADPVRVIVQVPQDVAPGVKPDLAATVVARGYGARAFPGKVTRAAGELDPALRTMGTEIRVANPDGALLPGMYVQASLSLASPHQVFEIPATSLYNDAHGTRVATVDAAGKIHFVDIVIERDTGATIQVASGLTGKESIVKVGVASYAEGTQVDVQK
jgi:RND family efflux transporter MFP subunit